MRRQKTSGQHQSHLGFDQLIGTIADQKMPLFAPYPSFSPGIAPNWPALVPFPPQTILGKGAKHWRSGDWMCTNGNNHNYASRAECNRCKTQREGAPLQDSATSEPLNTASQPVDAV